MRTETMLKKFRKSQKRVTSKQRRKISRAKKILKKLSEVKDFYEELDTLIRELRISGFTEGAGMMIVDNFKERDFAFRTVSVRRFELKEV